MTDAMADWDVFRNWEHGMLRHADPGLPVPINEAELSQEWHQKANQAELVGSICAVQAGVVDAQQHLNEVEQAQERLPDNWSNLDVGVIRDLHSRITSYLGVRRALKEHLHAYKHELNQPDPQALSPMSVRADKFVADWLRDNDREISRFKIQRGECRKWLAENGQLLSLIDREGPTATPSDDDGRDGGSQRKGSTRGGGQPNGGGQHHGGGDQDRRSASANAGAGHPVNNGERDDGGEDDDEDRRNNRSAQDLRNSHYRNRQDLPNFGSDDGEKSRERSRGTSRVARDNRATPQQPDWGRLAGLPHVRGRLPGDLSLPDHEDEEDNGLPAGANNPQSPFLSLPDRPRTEAEWRMVIEYAVTHPNYAGYPLLPGRTDPYQDLSVRAIAAVAEIKRRRLALQPNLDLDAGPRHNGAARKNDLAATRNASGRITRWNQRPDAHPRRPGRTDVFNPYLPPGKGSKRGNPGADNQTGHGGVEEAGNNASRKRSRRSGSLPRASSGAALGSGSGYPDVDAVAGGLANMTQDVQDYFQRTHDEWSRDVDENGQINTERVYHYIERLVYAYERDPLWNWHIAPTLSRYIDRAGREQWSWRTQDFLRRTFDRIHTDLDDVPHTQEVRDQYERFHDRLLTMQSTTPEPPRLTVNMQFDAVLAAYAARIAAAEPYKVHSRWQQLIATLESQNNGLGAMNARMHFLDAKQKLQASNELTWPPNATYYDVDPGDFFLPNPIPNPKHAGWAGIESHTLGFDYPHLQGSWNFDRTLGEGGYGHAGLWTRLSPSGSILDRKVAKESWFKEATWAMADFWIPPAGSSLPREWWVQGTMTLLPEPTSMVKGLQCKLYGNRLMHRIYMEFCPHGDVYTLLTRHQHMCTMKDRDQNSLRDEYSIPNVVVWCFFEALIRAVCLLHDRKVPDDGDDDGDDEFKGYDKDSTFILHKDIKPLNVFLSPPDAQLWPKIPVPKLGDFGLALESSATNVDAPWAKGCGTRRYRPPEMIELPDNILTSEIPLLPESDIWTIGMSMFELMDWEHWGTIGTVDYTRSRADFPKLSQGARDFYDERLCTLVEWCLNPFPTERPIAAQLWREIQAIVNADPTPEDGLGLSMKQRGLRANDRLLYQRDPHADWAQ